MNPIPIITSSTTLLLSLITCFLNSYLVISIFCVKKFSKKSDFYLIFGRFFVDIGYSFQTSLNLFYLFIDIISPHQNFLKNYEKNILFYFSWPNYLLGSARAILVFFITLDRVLATCLSVLYYKYRSEFPTNVIFGFVFLYSVFENFILFIICDYVISVPDDCTHLGCSLNMCYHQGYYLNFEQIIYTLIGILSVILSTRLFIWNNFRKATGTTRRNELSRANRLAVLDTFFIFVFGLLPPFLFTHAPTTINFETVGPLSALCKNCGFVIETVMICHVLLWKRKIEPGSSHRTTS